MLRFRNVSSFIMTAALGLALAGCGGKSDSPTAPKVTAPASPANLSVSAGDRANIVSWDASGGAASYNLYFKVGAGATTADTKIAGVTSPYSHGSLTNGTLYSYVVTAVNSAGESGATTAVQATPTAGPIFVSTSTGLDSRDGSQASPVKTLGHAYVIAQATSRTVIRMEAGTYAEEPSFQPGIDVQGGYDLPGWSVGTNLTSFQLPIGGRASANSITVATAISRIEIKGDPAGVNPNLSSIALSSSACNANLVFTNCRFVSVAAASGLVGANGSQGAVGAAGAPGANGNCDGANGAGGPGGNTSILFCNGGAGGAGGTASGSGNGVLGTQGSCLGGSGGSGGAVGNPGSPGGAGGDGGVVSDAADGAAAAASGAIVSGNWVPLVSNNGSTGTNGLGGGGGGGGGAQQCAFCLSGGGNGGGGGGEGGRGGGAGQGAPGGRASFAVFLFDSSPTFVGCTFQSANGGAGGAGGAGAVGGVGGVGGLGASACTGEIGAGGRGGRGSTGGRGGAGAGGPGGPSYCVYKAGTSAPTLTSPTYIPGSPGAGGTGGLHATGSAGNAPNGPAGVGGNTN